MKANEIKRDAQDLQDDTEVELGDTAHKMRKVSTNDIAELSTDPKIRSCCVGSTT